MPAEITNVAEFLLDGKDPRRCALKFLDQEVTYGDLQENTGAIAKALLTFGARKDDRVILAGDNSAFWVAAYLGIMRAGLVCVPLPSGVSVNDFGSILQLTGANIVCAQRSFVARAASSLAGLHLVTDREISPVAGVLSQQTFADVIARGPGAGAFPAIYPDDLAALMFTSGSTGQPRGVMISHRNIIANTTSIIESLRLTEADRIMAVLPFHYCFGTSLLHTHLRVGGSLVVDPRFMYPETVLQRMIETECTGFAGVPSHFQILLGVSSLRKKTFPHLRYVQQAGGHLAPRFVRELREALPDKQIFVMYGQTEATARLSYLPPELLDAKPGSIGKGIPGVVLEVLRESGEPVRPGETGEIVARGPNIARGYWAEPAESAATFRNGKLYTGDLGTVDEDGYIYVLDRARDILKCGGQRVSCRQLEDDLLASDELVEAAVIGVPDAILGEAVKAFVVPRPGSGDHLPDRLHRFCRDRFPPRLVPREFVVLTALPKGPTGKVLKANLKGL